MSLPKTKLAEVQIPPKKPQKYLFHVPRTSRACNQADYRLFSFSETGNSGHLLQAFTLPPQKCNELSPLSNIFYGELRK